MLEKWTPEEISEYRIKLNNHYFRPGKLSVYSMLTEIESLQSQVKELQYVSVDDRLSEENGTYDTYGFWHEFFYAEFIDGQWSFQGVTHWRKPVPLSEVKNV